MITPRQDRHTAQRDRHAHAARLQQNQLRQRPLHSKPSPKHARVPCMAPPPRPQHRAHLRVAPSSALVRVERDGLLLLQHVLQVRRRARDAHALAIRRAQRCGNLRDVLKVNLERLALGLRGCTCGRGRDMVRRRLARGGGQLHPRRSGDAHFSAEGFTLYLTISAGARGGVWRQSPWAQSKQPGLLNRSNQPKGGECHYAPDHEPEKAGIYLCNPNTCCVCFALLSYSVICLLTDRERGVDRGFASPPWLAIARRSAGVTWSPAPALQPPRLPRWPPR